MVESMSPLSTPARMHFAPVRTGRLSTRVGVIAAITTTTITTGTGTTGSGRGVVRR
jgi:hypothetical protein